jgi:hypothetical protein
VWLFLGWPSQLVVNANGGLALLRNDQIDESFCGVWSVDRSFHLKLCCASSHCSFSQGRKLETSKFGALVHLEHRP